MSEEFCNKVRENTLKQYADGILNRQTAPQRKVNAMLDKLEISFVNEKIFKYYSVDNYISNSNLIIEVMGDYFHANPILYNDYNKLNEMQQKDIIRDKRKKYLHKEILRYRYFIFMGIRY